MTNRNLLVVGLLFVLLAPFPELRGQVFSEFYEVFRSDSMDAVRAMVARLENVEAPSSQQQVYLGALYMRLADFQKVPAQRLASFKQGRALLEQEIEQAPQNAEYRFIRMVIQEQAPAFLKYNEQVQADKAFVLEVLETMTPELKKEVELYLQRH